MATGAVGTAHTLWRGDPGYEEARAAGWNRRVPNRYPAVIVRASSATDVADAVRLAGTRSLRVAVRAGGHSMCGASLHDGGMLIDLSRMRAVSVDRGSRTAAVQPGVTGEELLGALTNHGLAFPVAHHASVPLSGFVLSGGLGWNTGAWGPACASLRCVEIVDGNGDHVVADDRENTDPLWAARGAGSAFVGVATQFHLDTQPRPGAIRTSMHMYPLAEVEAVSRWASDVTPHLARGVEMLLVLASAPPGTPAGPAGKAVGVIATAFANDAREASRALAPLETCPVLPRALRRDVDQAASFDSLFAAIGGLLPAKGRYCEESLWSQHDLGAVLPRLAEGLVGAPSARSLILAAPLGGPGPDHAALNAAFAPPGRTLALCYGIWNEVADDSANQRWLEGLIADCAPLTTGRYIAETDVTVGSARTTSCFTPGALQQLRQLRRRHDPDGVFHTWLDTQPALEHVAHNARRGGPR